MDRRRIVAALVGALVAAAVALGLVERSPRVEVEFPVSSPATRGFGAPCDEADFTQVAIFGRSRAWNRGAVLPLRAAVALARAWSGYVPREVQTYACRRIAGSSTWSHHAWALAVDFDPADNAYGRDPAGTLVGSHPEFIRAFERVGFVWGGRWSTPDPMHFEWDGPRMRHEANVPPGERGPRVRRLEALLADVGLPVRRDGRYEGRDLISVAAFQKRNGIVSVEGVVVGPVTWTLLELEAA